MYTYKTIDKSPIHSEIKDKNRKFFGYAFPLDSEKNVAVHLSHLRHVHPKADHFCYAFRVGTENIVWKTNDDGEPKNSAGSPILGQLNSFDLTNILIVVVRYFGGTKLGVGGLVSAYKNAAQAILKNCEIIEKTIYIKIQITHELENINVVMRIVKSHALKIISPKHDLNAELIVLCPKKNTKSFFEKFTNFHKISLKIID